MANNDLSNMSLEELQALKATKLNNAPKPLREMSDDELFQLKNAKTQQTQMPIIPMGDGTYASPLLIKEAQKRLSERQTGKSDADINFGNALYALSNAIPHAQSVIGGIGETLTGTQPPTNEGLFGNMALNSQIEDVVGKLRKQQSPVSSVLGNIAGLVGPYKAGTTALEAIPGLESRTLEEGATTLPKALEVLKSMVRGGVTTGALGVAESGNTEHLPLNVALGAGGELAEPIVDLAAKGLQSGGSKLLNSFLKIPKKELKMGKNLGQAMIDRGLYGTEEGLLNKAGDMLETNENQLQNLLKSSDTPINKQHMIDELNRVKNDYVNSRDYDRVKTIDDKIDMINKEPDLTPSDANVWKRAIYSKRAGAYGRDATGIEIQMDKAIARGLKKGIEDVAPEAKDINKELQVYGQLKDRILDKRALESKKFGIPLSLKDLVLGTAAGAYTHHPTVGIAALLGKALMNTTPGATLSALGLNRISQLLGAASSNIGPLAGATTAAINQ